MIVAKLAHRSGKIHQYIDVGGFCIKHKLCVLSQTKHTQIDIEVGMLKIFMHSLFMLSLFKYEH